MHETFYFRAPDRATFLHGLSTTFSEEGVSPSRLIELDPQHGKKIDPSIGVFVPAGEWWKMLPTVDSEGNLNSDGVRGDHAIANVRTDDETLKELFRTVPVGEKRNGIERVEPSSPVRPFA